MGFFVFWVIWQRRAVGPHVAVLGVSVFTRTQGLETPFQGLCGHCFIVGITLSQKHNSNKCDSHVWTQWEHEAMGKKQQWIMWTRSLPTSWPVIRSDSCTVPDICCFGVHQLVLLCHSRGNSTRNSHLLALELAHVRGEGSYQDECGAHTWTALSFWPVHPAGRLDPGTHCRNGVKDLQRCLRLLMSMSRKWSPKRK